MFPQFFYPPTPFTTTFLFTSCPGGGGVTWYLIVENPPPPLGGSFGSVNASRHCLRFTSRVRGSGARSADASFRAASARVSEAPVKHQSSKTPGAVHSEGASFNAATELLSGAFKLFSGGASFNNANAQGACLYRLWGQPQHKACAAVPQSSMKGWLRSWGCRRVSMCMPTGVNVRVAQSQTAGGSCYFGFLLRLDPGLLFDGCT